MKNRKINTRMFMVLILLITLALNSCGARKAGKSRNTEKIESVIDESLVTEKKEDSNLKITENTQVDDKNEIVTEEEFYEPVNPLRLSSLMNCDGKTIILNNAKKTIRKTTSKNHFKTEKNKKTEEAKKMLESVEIKKKQEILEIKKKEDQKIECEALKTFNLFWLLIPIGLIAIIWRNKTKLASWIGVVR
jgi:hypothetical protein